MATAATAINNTPETPRNVVNSEHDYLRKNVDPVIMPMIEKLVLHQPDNVFEFMQRYLAGEPLGPARYSTPRGRSLPTTRRRKMAAFMAEKVLPVMEEFTQRVVYERPAQVKDFVQTLVSMQIHSVKFTQGTAVEVYIPTHQSYSPAVIQQVEPNGRVSVVYSSHPGRIETESDIETARVRLIQSDSFTEGDVVECHMGNEIYSRGKILSYQSVNKTYTIEFDNATTEENVFSARVRAAGPENNSVKPTSMSSVILMIGIDGAGKSTLLSSLQGDLEKEHSPSVGFSSISFELSNGKTSFYDLGGGPSIRSVWKEYYADAHGIIFVVDSSDSKHVKESVQVLQETMKDSQLAGKPLLLYVNKQDKPETMTAKEVQQLMQFQSKQIVKAVPCVAKPSENKNVVDERLEVGLTWLFQEIKSNYEVLNERVTRDTDKKKEAYAKKIQEQKQRVQSWIEERERMHMSEEDKPMHNETKSKDEAEPEEETPEEQDDGPKCATCKTKPATSRCAASKWTAVCDECLTTFL